MIKLQNYGVHKSCLLTLYIHLIHVVVDIILHS